MSYKISFVVVTYRRDDALKATLERIHGLIDRGTDCEVVLVDNNADGVDRSSSISHFASSRLVASPANLGCTGGRNAGIAASRGDLVLLIDDDALLVEDDTVERVVQAFDRDPRLGALGFRSVLADRISRDPSEFPHTDKSRIDTAESFETFRFIGVGHALRRSAIDEVGAFREDFFYGMEEFELSFRLMKAGWRIVYEPRIWLLHMKDAAGRLPSGAAVERHFVNKMKIAWMHLPAGIAVLTATAWTVKSALRGRGRANIASAWVEVARWAIANRTERRPAHDVVKRIRELGGSPWR